MLITIVEFEVPASSRQALLDHIEQQAHSVRSMDGNLAYNAFASGTSNGRIVLLQEWEHEKAFSQYRASDDFSALNERLKPEMTGPPSSRSFNAMPL